HQSSQKAKEQFVGTWKLVSYEVGASHPMGRDAVGLLTYDANGRMSLQVMRLDRPKFRATGGKEGGYEAGIAEEVMSAYRGYIAYFGTYKVDEKGRFVTHHIEGSLFPNWVGRDQIEFFELSNDRLTFGIDPIRYVWKRVT
ncbi:MAG: lipocalin-like domain-containing protein, partial [Candidatus Methylomirabilales bacterium]